VWKKGETTGKLQIKEFFFSFSFSSLNIIFHSVHFVFIYRRKREREWMSEWEKNVREWESKNTSRTPKENAPHINRERLSIIYICMYIYLKLQSSAVRHNRGSLNRTLLKAISVSRVCREKGLNVTIVFFNSSKLVFKFQCYDWGCIRLLYYMQKMFVES
jgi:hypothetical protein